MCKFDQCHRVFDLIQDAHRFYPKQELLFGELLEQTLHLVVDIRQLRKVPGPVSTRVLHVWRKMGLDAFRDIHDLRVEFGRISDLAYISLQLRVE